MSDPFPPSRLNEALEATVLRSAKLIWTIIIAEAVLIITVAVVAGMLGYQRLTERTRVNQDVTQITSSQCQFYFPLATAPLVLNPSSKLGVQIVEGSRLAVHGLGCPGELPPPSRVLVELGRKYHVPITY